MADVIALIVPILIAALEGALGIGAMGLVCLAGLHFRRSLASFRTRRLAQALLRLLCAAAITLGAIGAIVYLVSNVADRIAGVLCVAGLLCLGWFGLILVPPLFPGAMDEDELMEEIITRGAHNSMEKARHQDFRKVGE